MIPHWRATGTCAPSDLEAFDPGMLLVSLVSMGLASVVAQTPHATIRPTPGDAEALVALARRRSPTFARLLHQLDHPALVVYVELHRGLRNGAGQMTLLTAAAGVRRVRIALDAHLGIRDQIVVLGHELYHATELAAAPHVVDEQSLEALYAGIGFSVGRKCGRRFDTAEARAVAWEIARELDTLRGVEGQWAPR